MHMALLSGGDWLHFTMCMLFCHHKMLNAYNYLMDFYGGDLYSEGLTSKVTLWPMYYGIYNRKQKFKMLLQSSVISVYSIAPFLGPFSKWKDKEKILPILKDKIAYNSTIL